MEVELTENTVKCALAEFYATSDAHLRDRLNKWLMEAKDQPAIGEIAWNLTGTDDELIVQQYAANCLYDCLLKGRLDKVLQETEGTGRIESFRSGIVKRCEMARTPLIRTKMTEILALLVVQTVPDVWEDPIGDICLLWCSKRPDLLSEALGAIPAEFGQLSAPVTRRAQVREKLREKYAVVQTIIAELLQKHQTAAMTMTTDLFESLLRCVEAWMAFCCDISPWTNVIIGCLQIADGAKMDALSKFFCRFVENTQLMKIENFLGNLFDFLALPLTSAADASAQDSLWTDVANMRVSLMENHTAYVLKYWNERPSVSILIEAMITLTEAPGYYPTDEEYSGLTARFWYNLHVEAQRYYDDVERKAIFNRLDGLYVNLSRILIRKLRYPPEDCFSNWTADEKERFATYRNDFTDVLVCCHLATSSTPLLNQLFGLKNDGWEDAELVFFVLEAVSDNVTADNQALLRFFDETLSGILPALVNATVANAALRMLHRNAHTIGIREKAFRAAVTLTLPFFDEPTTVGEAVSTAEQLLNAAELEFLRGTTEVVQMASAAMKCFQDERYKKSERLKALTVVGLVLSAQSDALILEHLQTFFGPRVERLRALCREGHPSKPSNEELLAELDVFARLLGAIGNSSARRAVGDGRSQDPIVEVLLNIFDLLYSSYAISNRDAEVAQRVCDIVKNGMIAAGDLGVGLIDRGRQLVMAIFPPHACALHLAKTIFMLYVGDELMPQMRLFLNDITVQILMDEEWRNYDALEAYLNLCYQLVKKRWNFFDATINLKDVIFAAGRTLSVTAESPLVKTASLFLCEVLPKKTFRFVVEAVDAFGTGLVTACLERLRVELLTSCVEHLADVIFILLHFYTEKLNEWWALVPANEATLVAMFKELGNKRKFREFAKRFNIECRRKALAAV